MNTPCVVAIDGPAGSGKTSVARIVAERRGWTHVDSGSMYRALTWHLLQAGVDTDDPREVVRALPGVEIEDRREGHSIVFRINGRDPGDAIRLEKVNRHVSAVAAVPEVRRRLVRLQRALVRWGPLVMEGRDIGTVVFPETPHKFYLDASPEVRAERRRRETGGADADVFESLAARDRKDSSRPVAPLKPAADAEMIETAPLDLETVVRRVESSIDAKGATAS